MTRLLLVRHAQSQNNFSDHAIYKQYRHDRVRAQIEAERARRPDPELSEIGRAQAEQLAEALVPALVEVGDRLLVISSPMRRALQTAMPLASGAGIERERFICHAELFEIGSGYYGEHAPPSTRAAQLESDYPIRCQAVPSDDLYPGKWGESERQARARVDRVIAWFEGILNRDEHDLLVVVAHGNLLTRWLRRWIGVPWGRGLAFVHANASLTMLSWDPYDGLLLEFANETNHLDPELCTGGTGDWWCYALPDLQLEHFIGWSEVYESLAPKLVALRQHLLEPEGKSLADYAELDERNIHVVARVADAVAGYVQYDPQLGRLQQLVVAPSHRRGRIGRRLVAEVEFEARLQQREQLRVHAWVDAVDYYRSLGFVEEGPVVTGSGVPWQAMVKTLPPLPAP
ncbi:MAG: GNAT family N-acetyltransferase [Enhygromyxa sp.]